MLNTCSSAPPLNGKAFKERKFPHVTVNIFKHFRLYSCEVYYRNINKRKFDKKLNRNKFFIEWWCGVWRRKRKIAMKGVSVDGA